MSVAGLASLNTGTASDIALANAARAGEDEAFEELYRRYHGQIAAFAQRIVRDQGRAEDVAQEAFVSALRRMRQTKCDIQFKPWIYEIARNAAIDSLRRAGRAKEVSFEVQAAAGAAQIAAPGAPEASVMHRQRFENLCGALDELSDSHHRIIVMRELEGLSYREIGARMDLSPAAVESTLFRARRKLGHEYAQLDTGRRCQSMGIVIARLAEGVESRPDRVRLDRHARRCSRCRALARRLGVEPILARPVRRRAAALLPLPSFLRVPRGSNFSSAPGASRAQQAAGTFVNPGFETAIQSIGKAAAVVGSALAIGGMGATLGGIGPLAVDGGRAPAEKRSGKHDSGRGAGDAVVPRGGRSKFAPPGFAGDGSRGPFAPQRQRGDRQTGQAPGPSAPPRSDSEAPALPGVPNLPPIDGRAVPITIPPIEAPHSSDLAVPSLPAEPQLPGRLEAPALPGQDEVGAPVQVPPAPVGAATAPSANLPTS